VFKGSGVDNLAAILITLESKMITIDISKITQKGLDLGKVVIKRVERAKWIRKNQNGAEILTAYNGMKALFIA